MVSQVSVLETNSNYYKLSLPLDLGCHESLGGPLHNEGERPF